MIDELEKYINSLTNYAYSICGDHNLSDDLVQATLVKAIEKKETYKTDISIRSWLRRILHNTYVDYIKHFKVQNSVSIEHIEIELPNEEALLRCATEAEIAHMQSMSKRDIAICKLFASGLTRREVAQKLGMQSGTVASSYLRIRAKARAYVTKHNERE